MRRQATIAAVDTATGTVTIQLAGDPTNLPGIACLASYTPSVNDVVWVDKLETDWLIIGAQVPALSPPRGIIEERRRISDVTGIGATATPTDITNLSITFTATADRTYNVVGEIVLESTPLNGDIHVLFITDGSNNILKQMNSASTLNGIGTGLHIERSFTGLTGSQTWKLRGGHNASGSNTCIARASAANPSYIRVEDIGPAVTYL
jgi:hypothetical protein